MSFEQVRERFNRYAVDYDDFVPRVVPKYHEQHEAILAVIPFEPTKRLKALDLGAGTGVLSHLILEAFGEAEVVAVDLADNMLEACRKNLSRFEGRLTLKKANFVSDDLEGGYDLAVSGLAVHHLTDDEKRRLFARVLESLSPGGVFIVRDVVLGATPHLTELYRGGWKSFMRSTGEDDEVWLARHLKEDKPASVESQTAWLSEAGFTDVACHWRYLNFAVFGGRKPA